MNALSPSDFQVQAKRRFHQLGVILLLTGIGNLLVLWLSFLAYRHLTTSTDELTAWAHIAGWVSGTSLVYAISCCWSFSLYKGNFAAVCKMAQNCAFFSVMIPGFCLCDLIYTPLGFIWIYLQLAPLSVQIPNLLLASDWLFCIWLYRALTTGIVEKAIDRSNFAPEFRATPALGFLASLGMATIFLSSSLIFPHLDGSFQVAQEAARQAELKLGDDYQYFSVPAVIPP